MTAIASAQVLRLLKSGRWLLRFAQSGGKRVDHDLSLTGAEVVDGQLVLHSTNSTVRGPKLDEVKFTADDLLQPASIHVYTRLTRQGRKGSDGGGNHEAPPASLVMLLENVRNSQARKAKQRWENGGQRHTQARESRFTRKARQVMDTKVHIIKAVYEQGPSYSIVIRWNSDHRLPLVKLSRANRDLYDGTGYPTATYVPHTGNEQILACVISTHPLTSSQAQAAWHEFLNRGCPEVPA